MFRSFSHVVPVDSALTVDQVLIKNGLTINHAFHGEVSVISCGGTIEEADLREFGVKNKFKVIDQRTKKQSREVRATIDNTVVTQTLAYVLPNARIRFFLSENTYHDLKQSLRDAIKRNSDLIICTWSSDHV
jgi:hypothetical protein